MKKLAVFAVMVFLTSVVGTTAHAQKYPSRTVEMIVAYGPGGSAPKVTLRLLNREGGQIAPLPDPVLVPSTSTYEAELVLAPLPPAEYLFEITATIGDDTVKKLVALKIVG